MSSCYCIVLYCIVLYSILFYSILGYAISIARKLGAEIFLLPHDIVEVKNKMILLFIGSVMSLDQIDNPL